MTPTEAAQFILSDCQDPVLKAKADREAHEDLMEALKDPAFKAKWDANIQAMADEIDRRAVEEYVRLYRAGHQ